MAKSERSTKRRRLQRGTDVYHTEPLRREQQRIRCSWDIGTTSISVSHALVRVTTWPSDDEELHEIRIARDMRQVDWGDGKTPYISNICAYHKDQFYLGQEVATLLARGIIDDADVISLFKLAISEVGDEDVLQAKAKVEAAMRRHGKEDVEVVADLVAKVWARARAQMTEVYRFTEKWRMPLDFILGVPSTWTVVENQKILSGFQNGVMNTKTAEDEIEVTYELCHEPVASIANVLNLDNGPNNYKVNDTIIVADAGGGTVDLATWTIEKLHPPRLRQEVVGNGGYCGSATVNERFKKRLTSALSKSMPSTFDYSSVAFTRLMRRLDIGFEETKKSFNNDEVKYWVSCPGLTAKPNEELLRAGYEIQEELLAIDRTEMEEIFKPCVKTVEQLVRFQIDRYRENHDGMVPNALLLLGCFSLSPYLYSRLNAAFSHETLIDRPSSSMACMVSDGGILAGGWSGFITKRMPLISYGFSQDIDYDEVIHQEQWNLENDNYGNPEELPDDFLGPLWCPFEARPMLLNRVKWAIRRGVPIGQQITHDLYESRYLYPVDQAYKGAEITLSVPLYMSRRESSDDMPIYGPNNDITKVATLEVTISNPENRYGYTLTEPNDEGSVFWKVDSVVRTKLTGWTLSWEVIIPPKGDIDLIDDEKARKAYGEFRSSPQVCCIAAGFRPGGG